MTAKPTRIAVFGDDSLDRFLSLLELAKQGVEIVAVGDDDGEAARRLVWPFAGELVRHRTLGQACDRGYDIPSQAAERFAEVDRYDSFDAMLVGAQPLEGVVIAGAPEKRALRSIKALKRGCDVLVKPPMATVLDDCDEMVRVAEEYGRTLSVGYPWPFLLEGARSLFAGGEIGTFGQLTGVRFTVLRDGPSDPDFWADASTGGERLDLGGHGGSAMLPFFYGRNPFLWGSKPCLVRARRYNTFGLEIDDDATEIQIRFTDKRMAEIKVCRAFGATDQKVVLELSGKGWLCAPGPVQRRTSDVSDPGAFGVARWREYADLPTAVADRPALSYAAALVKQGDEWTRAIHSKERLWLTAEQAADGEWIAHGADLSAKEERGPDGWGPWVDRQLQPLSGLNDVC